MSVFMEYIQEYAVYVAGVGIILGLFLIFMGFWFFKCTMFFAGLIGTALILLLLIFGAIGAQPTAEWVNWVILGACCVAGLIVGILLIKYEKAAVFILGAVGGYFLATVLYAAVLYKINSSQWVLWVSVIILALICGFIALKVWEHCIIILTSFIGSYITAKCIGVYAGGFPNEIELYHYLESSDNGYSIENSYYFYFGGIIVFTIIGTIVQEKHKSKRDKKKEQKKYERLH